MQFFCLPENYEYFNDFYRSVRKIRFLFLSNRLRARLIIFGKRHIISLKNSNQMNS